MLYTEEKWDYNITIPTIVIMAVLLILMLREFWQMIKLKKRHVGTQTDFILSNVNDVVLYAIFDETL